MVDRVLGEVYDIPDFLSGAENCVQRLDVSFDRDSNFGLIVDYSWDVVYSKRYQRKGIRSSFHIRNHTGESGDHHIGGVAANAVIYR